jgi:protein-tyrosine phosphatase
MIRVLFVCLGNICRSPMAEAVFKHMVDQAGLSDKIFADSAGTGGWHLGEGPHHGTRGILEKNQIAYGHFARLLIAEDMNRFDYIIAMDRYNLRDIQGVRGGRAKVGMLMDYASHSDEAVVPDPYYDGQFERVYELVTDACAGLLAHIRKEHLL